MDGTRRQGDIIRETRGGESPTATPQRCTILHPPARSDQDELELYCKKLSVKAYTLYDIRKNAHLLFFTSKPGLFLRRLLNQVLSCTGGTDLLLIIPAV